MAVLPLAFLLLFHVNIASVAEWRIIAKRSTDSGELVEKNVESSDEMDPMKIGKKMFVFAYCIYERTKEAQANCLHKHLSKQWQLHEAAEQSCDDAGNGCAFMVASSSDAGTKATNIVVAFRGTTTLLQTFREVVDSVQFGCVPFRQEQENHSNKGYVNKYFHSAIMDEHDNGAGSSIWERVLQVVKPLILVPKWRIAFTGHSLGGALASLAALQMHEHFQQPLMGSQSKPTRIEHSSFGQPRVGCPEFAAYFDRSIPHSLRFIHGADMIPLVPPESALCTRCNPASTNVNYKHHGQAIAVTSRPCSAMSCGDSCARCQGDVCLRLFFSCLQLLHFPRFLTDHFEYFNLNIKSKVSLFGFLEVHKLTRLQNLLSLPILAKSMLQIVLKCLGSS